MLLESSEKTDNTRQERHYIVRLDSDKGEGEKIKQGREIRSVGLG